MAGDLLVVWHPAPKSIARLRDAVLAGCPDAGDPFPVRSPAARDAEAADVRDAAATVLITNAHFRAVEGTDKGPIVPISLWIDERPSPRPGMPVLPGVKRDPTDA